MAVDLTTVANVKAQGAASGSASDAVLALLITQASAFIAKRTDVVFGATPVFSEIRDGYGGTELYVSHQPVVSITSLTIDGLAIPAQPADMQPGYFMADELLCLVGYRFCRGRKNVRLSGTEGYAAVPKDIEQACIELVASAFKRVPRGPDMVMEQVPASGMNVTWSQKDIPPYALAVLQQYRKVVPL